MQSDAKSVEDYLAELPTDRFEAITQLRELILERIPDGYEEAMNWGMITYQVPLSTYPDTYNEKPLMYAALASQKNHFAVYLSGIYQEDGKRDSFLEAYKETGKRLDVGQSCVRFRKIDDVPFEVIGDAIAAIPVSEFVSVAKAARTSSRK
ncbi:MAG: DUF1801 domain-containing protein [bacterium]|nr:DUF1801 domain-containing protein [bacterium]